MPQEKPETHSIDDPSTYTLVNCQSTVKMLTELYKVTCRKPPQKNTTQCEEFAENLYSRTYACVKYLEKNENPNFPKVNINSKFSLFSKETIQTNQSPPPPSTTQKNSL